MSLSWLCCIDRFRPSTLQHLLLLPSSLLFVHLGCSRITSSEMIIHRWPYITYLFRSSFALFRSLFVLVLLILLLVAVLPFFLVPHLLFPLWETRERPAIAGVKPPIGSNRNTMAVFECDHLTLKPTFLFHCLSFSLFHFPFSLCAFIFVNIANEHRCRSIDCTLIREIYLEAIVLSPSSRSLQFAWLLSGSLFVELVVLAIVFSLYVQ